MSQSDRQWLALLLEQACEPLFLRLHAAVAEEVLDELLAATGDLLGSEQEGPGGEALRLQGIAVAAIAEAESLRAAQQQRAADLAELHRQHEHSEDAKEQHLLLLRFLRDLDGRRDIDPADRRALRRWLDLGVADERVARRDARDRVREECHLRIIGVLLGHVFLVADRETASGLLVASRFFTCVRSYLRPDLPWRLAVAAAQACERLARAIGQDFWLDTFEMDCYQSLRRCCHEPQASIWLRVAAWRALRACRPQQWLDGVDRLIGAEPGGDDELFLRRCLIADLRDDGSPRADAILQRCLQVDPSDHVRQEAMRQLCRRGRSVMAEQVDRILGFRTHRPDACVPLRLQTLLSLLERWGEPGQSSFDRDWLLERWDWIARFASEEPLLRGLVDATPDALDRLSPPAHGIGEPVRRCLDGLYRLRGREEVPLPLRRRVSECIEQVVVPRDPFLIEILDDLRPHLALMDEGDRRRLPLPEAAVDRSDRLGRVLALLAQQDLGFSARLRGRELLLQRGMRFVPRLWRLLHELRNPAPDKRQGWHHGVGRSFAGPIRAHPLLVGEQSPTRVPGEPLVLEQEGQWRRHLPLMDDVLDACSTRGETLRCYSSHGITVVTPPADWRARLRLRLWLTWHFARLAALRNRPLASGEPDPYLTALRERGITITFEAWPAPEDTLATWAHDEDLHDRFAIPTKDTTGNQERVA